MPLEIPSVIIIAIIIGIILLLIIFELIINPEAFFSKIGAWLAKYLCKGLLGTIGNLLYSGRCEAIAI